MRDAWREVALGDVATLAKGISYRSEDLSDLAGAPFVTLKSVDRGGGFRREGLKRFSGEVHARYRVQGGDLLIANTDLTRDMAVLGCPVLIPNDPALSNAAFSLDLSRLDVDKTAASTEFLFLVLGQPDARAFMKQHASGTTVMHLRTREVPALRFVLPPLSDQRRIADLISALEASIASAVVVEAKARALLESTIDAIIFQAGHRKANIRELAAECGVIGGPFGSSLRTRDYVLAGVPVIRGENLVTPDGLVRGPFVNVTDEKARELRRNTAVPGDVVATQRGTLGQVAMVPVGEAEKYVISQSQMRFRADPDLSDARYVYYALSSRRMVAEIQSRQIATANPHINLGIFASLEIPAPPVATQVAIAAELGEIDAVRRAASKVSRVSGASRSALLTELLAGDHEIPESYDRFLDGAAGAV